MKVELSDNAAQREARLSEISAELSRTQAACARLSQVISQPGVTFHLDLYMLNCTT